MTKNTHSVIMIGATGAVGGQTLHHLLRNPNIGRITLLGRRPVEGIQDSRVQQERINIFDPLSYQDFVQGHDIAICTLGVGQPSKISKEEFLKIDKIAVLNFAKACKTHGTKHFQLLASVGINKKSSSFYLRSKGELVEELQSLNFDRLSIFQPSMIITPTNRYGISQAIVLKLWPLLDWLFVGSLRKFKGITIKQLGVAFTNNINRETLGKEYLFYDDFIALQ